MLRLIAGFHAVGQELPDVACGFHFAGNLACFIAVAPEVVHADGAFDGAAGVLRHDEAVEGFFGGRMGGGDKQRCA